MSIWMLENIYVFSPIFAGANIVLNQLVFILNYQRSG